MLNEKLIEIQSEARLHDFRELKKLMKGKYWNLVAGGKLPRAEAFKQTFEELGIIDEDFIQEFCQVLDHEGKAVLPEMRNLLAELSKRKGVNLAVLSNHSSEALSWLKDLNIVPSFIDPEKVLLASNIGCKKPELKSFEILLDTLGASVNARDVFFVDNRSENIFAAQEFGMRTHNYVYDCNAAEDNSISILREEIEAWLSDYRN